MEPFQFQSVVHHRRRLIYDVGRFLLLLSVLAAVVAYSTGRMNYNWQWFRVRPFLFFIEDGRFTAGPLINGLWVTLRISAFSLLLSTGLGLLTALMRLSDVFTARALARGYLELIRNTPLLVQIFFIYFVLSPLLGFGRFASAVIALSLFEGAYASEIFRAGILSIPKGQWEAAFSVGLSKAVAYRKVILPQAIRHMLPPLTSQAVSLIKDSALVSTIAIYDLTMKAQELIAETYLVFELWFTVAAIYLLMTAVLSFFIRQMEKRFAFDT